MFNPHSFANLLSLEAVDITQSAQTHPLHPAPLLACLFIALGVFGCQSSPQATAPPDPRPPRDLAMFTGDGTRATWEDLMTGIYEADVIFIGELHGHPEILLFEREVAEICAANFPGTALSLEMLERNEQPIVDQWMNEEISTDEFIDRTNSRNWGGPNSWPNGYQKVIDVVQLNDGVIYAANAPREYVRQSRLEGYDAVRNRPAKEHAYFAIPSTLDMGEYRERFAGEMRDNYDGDIKDELIESTFRAQAMWDATMARTVSEALDSGAPKVVHLLGRFHSDFRGGTIMEFAERNPDANIFIISAIESASSEVDTDDLNRGDILIHVYERERN